MPKKKPPKPPNHHIKGHQGAELTIAAKAVCECGWGRLALADDDEPLEQQCPQCGRVLEHKIITAPLSCPRCHGNRAVLSVTSVYRAQICANCASHGLAVTMQARAN